MSRKSKLIVFVAVLASLLEIIDTSIVNVALNDMMGNLGATLEDVSMVVTGYAIANAIVLPLAAWMGDRFGRRPYFLGCILLFTAVSVACGLAPNLPTLVVFRILQGFAGGALLPTSQTLIYEQFPKEKAGIAGAIFGMSVMIGPTLGPTIGGYLTDQLGWRSIFNINLPLGLLAFFVGALVIFNVDDEQAAEHAMKDAKRVGGEPLAPAPKKIKRPIDSIGLALLAAGIGCLQFTLERGQADDWFASITITICAIVAATALPLFVWWELRVEYPIINVRLFKDGIVRNGTMLMGMLGFFLYAIVFVLPVFSGRVLHYDATDVGILFIPGSMLTAFIMPFVGKAMSKIDPRALILVGLIGIETCLMMMGNFSSESTKGEVLSALYVRGFAMAFLFVPINSSILSQFKGGDMGQVSGLLNLFRQIGGSIGIALVGTLLSMRGQANYLDLASKVSLLNPVTQMQLTQIQNGMSGKMTTQLGQTNSMNAALQSLTYRIENQAFMMSFNQLVYTIAAIFLLAFIPLALLRFRKKVVTVSDSH